MKDWAAAIIRDLVATSAFCFSSTGWLFLLFYPCGDLYAHWGKLCTYLRHFPERSLPCLSQFSLLSNLWLLQFCIREFSKNPLIEIFFKIFVITWVFDILLIIVMGEILSWSLMRINKRVKDVLTLLQSEF